MKILGLSSFFHDSAAAIVDDNKVVAAAEEERFTRIKHDNNFPINSTKFVLNTLNVSAQDLDYVVFYEKPILKFHRILNTNRFNFVKNVKVLEKIFFSWNKKKISTRNYISDLLKIKKNKILFYEHHFSHAASSFYCSNFNQSDLITIDGVGEWNTATFGHTENKDLLRNSMVEFPHSIGLLYSAFTEFLGFEVNEGEYKVMGMAPYGSPIYLEKIDKLFKKRGINFELDLSFFNFNIDAETNLTEKFIKLFGEPRKSNEIFFIEKFRDDLSLNSEKFTKEICQKSKYYADIAASLQIYLEKFIMDIIKSFKSNSTNNNLCYAGGVAYNSAINSKIIKSNLYKNIFIQPAAGDSGGALGCALGVNSFYSKDSINYNGTYLGKEYSNHEIKTYLDNNSINYTYHDDFEKICKDVSKEIAAKKVIGWFQGKFEFGPRALGNRSILADPRFFENKKLINLKIKFREIFRPFAPSTLKEYCTTYYELDENELNFEPFRYMLSTVKVRENFKSKLAAVTHVDGTARIQIVKKEDNPNYYNLIKSFGDETGIYTLLNTSFNRKGEPIVNSPSEAANVFFWTDIDILVLNNFVLKK